MKKYCIIIMLMMCFAGFDNYIWAATKKIVTLWIFGDSTVKDYTNSQDACSPTLKIAGWGEYMHVFLCSDSLNKVANVIIADSVLVDNRANGGRAARTYINGKDTAVLKYAYANMASGDYMFIQFGHNDEADCINYPDRCTSISDFKMYIGMYVDSVLKKGATPILITPMVRNAWPEYNTHDNSDSSKTNQQIGNFSLAMQQVAKEKGVACIDLTQRSIDLFNSVGDTVTKYNYFRKVRSGVTLDSGCTSINDGTHFQPYGAQELARQIFYGLQNLYKINVAVADTNKGVVFGYSNGVKNKANTDFIQLTNNFSNGSGWYESKYNSTVKIVATPKSGYKFTGWSGDISGTGNPYTVSLTKNYSITANFADTAATAVSAGKSALNTLSFQISSRKAIPEAHINLKLAAPTNVKVTIFDIMGRKALTAPLKEMNAGNNAISISDICRKPGVYLCELEMDGESMTSKILIQ